MKTFTNFSCKIDKEFERINDRITAVQSKCSDQSSSSSMTELRQHRSSLKTDIDKKTGSILSKSHSIFDKVKETTVVWINWNPEPLLT